MICSTRTGKSSSNWLDRLRSNKGIPTGDDLDLDSFLLQLSTHSHSHSHSPLVRPTKPAHNRPTQTHDRPMAAILAELFNGATLTLTSQKCPRKQPNPKFFPASPATNSANSPAPVPAVTGGDALVAENYRCNEAEENDGEDAEDLKGFTRSEVTVIDTSCPGWKVDKFVFRKNSVWKVRERKPKSKFFAKKKSKATQELDINGIGISMDNVVNIEGVKAVTKLKTVLGGSM